jgi:hypothetical protein
MRGGGWLLTRWGLGRVNSKQINKEAKKKDGGRHSFFSKRDDQIKKARKGQ